MFTIDVVTAIILVVLSFFCGIFLTLLIQWYFFNKYLMKLPLVSKTEEHIVEPFQIPKVSLDLNELSVNFVC